MGPASLVEADIVRQALEERREAPVELRHAKRGDKRRLYELAERNARLAIEQDKLRTQRRRQQRVDALNDLREALGMDALPVRIEGFDISNLGPSHTVASMVAFEGGAPRKADYRRFKIRALEGRQDDFAAMQEVMSRRLAQWVEQRDHSPHDPSRDASFAALPSLVVIDGGLGQLSSGVAALGEFMKEGVTVISLAKRLEEIYVPGRAEPIRLSRDSRGAAAAPAHPRRGPPLRDRAPPAAPRQVDEGLRPGRAAGRGPCPQARAAAPLRIAGTFPRGDTRRAGSGAGAAGARWRGRSTSS